MPLVGPDLSEVNMDLIHLLRSQNTERLKLDKKRGKHKFVRFWERIKPHVYHETIINSLM